MPGLVKRIMSEFSQFRRTAHPEGAWRAPSPRQIQILTLICRGFTIRRLAGKLGLAERIRNIIWAKSSRASPQESQRGCGVRPRMASTAGSERG
jgi:hypothetical protein